MNHPSCAGWLNIVAVTLNMCGVLTLFYFRLETIAPLMPRQWVLDITARNLARVPWRRAGAVLIVLGWLVQVIAQFVPSGLPT